MRLRTFSFRDSATSFAYRGNIKLYQTAGCAVNQSCFSTQTPEPKKAASGIAGFGILTGRADGPRRCAARPVGIYMLSATRDNSFAHNSLRGDSLARLARRRSQNGQVSASD